MICIWLVVMITNGKQTSAMTNLIYKQYNLCTGDDVTEGTIETNPFVLPRCFHYSKYLEINKYLQNMSTQFKKPIIDTISDYKIDFSIPKSFEAILTNIINRIDEIQNTIQNKTSLLKVNYNKNVMLLLAYQAYDFFEHIVLSFFYNFNDEAAKVNMLERYFLIINYHGILKNENVLINYYNNVINNPYKKQEDTEHLDRNNQTCFIDEYKILLSTFLAICIDEIVKTKYGLNGIEVYFDKEFYAGSDELFLAEIYQNLVKLRVIWIDQSKYTCLGHHLVRGIVNIATFITAINNLKPQIIENIKKNYHTLIIFNVDIMSILFNLIMCKIINLKEKKCTKNSKKDLIYLVFKDFYDSINTINILEKSIRDLNMNILKYVNIEESIGHIPPRKCRYLGIFNVKYEYDEQKTFNYVYYEFKDLLQPFFNNYTTFYKVINEFHDNCRLTIVNACHLFEKKICGYSDMTKTEFYDNNNQNNEEKLKEIFYYDCTNNDENENSYQIISQVKWFEQFAIHSMNEDLINIETFRNKNTNNNITKTKRVNDNCINYTSENKSEYTIEQLVEMIGDVNKSDLTEDQCKKKLKKHRHKYKSNLKNDSQSAKEIKTVGENKNQNTKNKEEFVNFEKYEDINKEDRNTSFEKKENFSQNIVIHNNEDQNNDMEKPILSTALGLAKDDNIMSCTNLKINIEKKSISIEETSGTKVDKTSDKTKRNPTKKRNSYKHKSNNRKKIIEKEQDLCLKNVGGKSRLNLSEKTNEIDSKTIKTNDKETFEEHGKRKLCFYIKKVARSTESYKCLCQKQQTNQLQNPRHTFTKIKFDPHIHNCCKSTFLKPNEQINAKTERNKDNEIGFDKISIEKGMSSLESGYTIDVKHGIISKIDQKYANNKDGNEKATNENQLACKKICNDVDNKKFEDFINKKLVVDKGIEFVYDKRRKSKNFVTRKIDEKNMDQFNYTTEKHTQPKNDTLKNKYLQTDEILNSSIVYEKNQVAKGNKIDKVTNIGCNNNCINTKKKLYDKDLNDNKSITKTNQKNISENIKGTQNAFKMTEEQLYKYQVFEYYKNGMMFYIYIPISFDLPNNNLCIRLSNTEIIPLMPINHTNKDKNIYTKKYLIKPDGYTDKNININDIEHYTLPFGHMDILDNPDGFYIQEYDIFVNNFVLIESVPCILKENNFDWTSAKQVVYSYRI